LNFKLETAGETPCGGGLALKGLERGNMAEHAAVDGTVGGASLYGLPHALGESAPPEEAGLSKLGVASDFGLSLALHFLRKAPPAALPHVLPWLRSVSGAVAPVRVRTPWERACPEVLPGLDTPGWVVGPSTDRASLPQPLAFIAALEARVGDIRREFLALRGSAAFQEYRAPRQGGGGDGGGGAAAAAGGGGVAASEGGCGGGGGGGGGDGAPQLGERATDAGAWNVCYLQLHGAGAAEGVGAALARCPATAALLAAVPRGYGHAFFSVLAPGTHITPHCGPSNKKLRVHLPLVVPPGAARMRVGGTTHALSEGRALCFQDSWEHEAWVDAGAPFPRAVLIVDVWHAALTDAEVKLLAFVRGSTLRGARAASAARALPPSDDFFAVLRSGAEHRARDEEVFGPLVPVRDD
jgi:aspartate beta-hydroxylase